MLLELEPEDSEVSSSNTWRAAQAGTSQIAYHAIR